MRALAYCRVSTQEQAREEHYTLANQEARCRDFIKHKSWRLVKVLRNVGSGKSAEREGYQELLAAIRDGQVDVVVTYRLDRLSRNVADVYDALDLFREKGVGFVSVQEAFDTTTAMGRAMLGVAAVFAQLTREMISENTKDGLLRRAQLDKELSRTTEAERALDDFGATWEVLSGDERREILRGVVEHLRVLPDYAELKILCLPEVRLDLRFRRPRKALTGETV